MECPYCASENSDDARQCTLCGGTLSFSDEQHASAPESAPTEPAPALKKKPGRRWLPALLLLLIPVLGIALALTGEKKPPAYTVPQATWQGFVKEYPLSTVYARDDQLVSRGIGKDLHPWLTSQDGSVAILHTLDGEVHMLQGEALSYVARDVQSILLSRDGRSLGCIDIYGTLQLINTRSMEKDVIAENVVGAAISPDGKALAYHCRKTDGSTAAFLYTGGEHIFLADDMLPFALSNGGKNIFCLEEKTGGLYLLDGRGNCRKIIPTISLTEAVCLNADHTQLLFRAGNSSYLWNGGESRIPVGLSSAFAIIDPVTHSKTIRVENGVSVITLGVSSFAGHFYTDRDTLLYLDGNLTTHFVAREIPRNGWQLTADRKTLFYRTKENTLMRVTAAKPDRSVALARDAVDFAVTGDGGALYVLDSRGSLWYLGGKDMPKLVTDGASRPAMTHDGICLYLTPERSLGFSQAGSAGQVVLTEVHSVYTTPTVTYVGTGYDTEKNVCSIYAAAEGADFRLLLDAGT